MHMSHVVLYFVRGASNSVWKSQKLNTHWLGKGWWQDKRIIFHFRQIEQQAEISKDRIKKYGSVKYYKGPPYCWIIECKKDDNKFVEVGEAKIMQDLGCVIDLELQKSQISDMPDCDGKPEHFQKGFWVPRTLRWSSSSAVFSQSTFTLLKCNIHIYKLM